MKYGMVFSLVEGLQWRTQHRVMIPLLNLVLLFTLSLASERRFDVKDDIFAFPQVRLAISGFPKDYTFADLHSTMSLSPTHTYPTKMR